MPLCFVCVIDNVLNLQSMFTTADQRSKNLLVTIVLINHTKVNATFRSRSFGIGECFASQNSTNANELVSKEHISPAPKISRSQMYHKVHLLIGVLSVEN